MIAPIVMMMLLFLGGCTPVYLVQVNGFADPDAAGRIVPNVKIHVAENARAENPLLDREIRVKIEKILKSRGFIITSRETADLFCTFNYGVGTGLTQIGSIPVTSPPVTSSVVVSQPDGTAQVSAIMTPGTTTYIPYARTAYDRWLNIVVMEAESFRAGKKDKILWYGDLVSSGTSRDLRTVIDYLLVAACEEFGTDTKRGLVKEIKTDDERLKGFRRD